ncbi:MAG TPA: hypothetical protein VFS77_23325 [Pyrinomonadaceae bacterium]|nr:hypothetical protein [Pyrinomonadaceae bacterium]
MKNEWDTSQGVFDKLLSWLDDDRDEAGMKYETIRRRLIKIFTCRGCSEPEDLADETINRVTQKISDIAPEYEGDPALYFYGVARYVHHEYVRAQNRVPVQPVPVDVSDDDDERMYECLDQCVEHLPETSRELVLRYYDADKRVKIENRGKLAEELGIAANALRIRAHRIRLLLRKCVQDCMEQPLVN